MDSANPFSYINLVGDGVMRGVTVVLPTEQVRGLLPHGLELGEQDVTPRGTHPITLFFQEMIRAHMTIPTLLPNMTYHEQILGVPFSYVTPGHPGAGRAGPFFFMPRLFLDAYLPVLGGKLFWGFAKQIANITVTADRWTVCELGGNPIIALDFAATGDFKPLAQLPAFEPIRQLMSQPLVSQVPAGEGPLFACSHFDKKWDTAQVRPLTTVVHIDQAFVPGLPCGRFPAAERAVGIDQSVLGSFEVKARWRQSLIYPSWLYGRQAIR